MPEGDRIGLFSEFLGIASIVLLILLVNANTAGTQFATSWNLLTAGTLGSMAVVFITANRGLFKDYFEVTSLKQMLLELTRGFFFSVPTLLLAVFFVFAGSTLIGSVTNYNQAALGSMTTETAWFIGVIQPFSESLVMMAAILLLYSLFKFEIKAPLPMVLSIIVVTLAFIGLHFAIQGEAYYPYTISGFSHYMLDFTGIGTAAYHGGLVYLPLGLFWAIVGVGYKSYFTMAGAHIGYNVMQVLFYSATAISVNVLSTFNLFAMAILLLLAVAFYFGKGFKGFEFNSFKVAN